MMINVGTDSVVGASGSCEEAVSCRANQARSAMTRYRELTPSGRQRSPHEHELGCDQQHHHTDTDVDDLPRARPVQRLGQCAGTQAQH